jgi:hypothetical protein
MYRLRWRSMLGAYGAIQLPVAVVLGLFETFVTTQAMADWEARLLTAVRSDDLAALQDLPVGAYAVSLLIGVILGIVGSIAFGAAVHVVDGEYRGRPARAAVAIRAAISRWLPLAGIYIALVLGLLGVVLIGSLATTVIAGLIALADASLAVFVALIGAVGTVAAVIFVALRWALAAPVVMCEGLGVLGSFGRSWRLVSGSTWRLLGYSLLYGLIQLLVLLAVATAFGIIEFIVAPPHISLTNPLQLPAINPLFTAVTALASIVTQAVLTPWWIAIVTLFYYDLRWRRGERPSGEPVGPAVD